MRSSNSTASETTAVVIGLGRAGARFIRACSVIDKKIGCIRIVGVADKDSNRLNELAGTGIATATDYKEILAGTAVDLIFVTATDIEHSEILRYAKTRHQAFRRILCEKPLTATLAEARMLEGILSEDDVTINFVERYSRIVSLLDDFILSHRRRVVRANFFWGKYRIRDTRPTIGILSELAHPIDLVLFLANVPTGTKFRIDSAIAVKSDFAQENQALFDTVHVAISFENCFTTVGSSSYVWARRDRRVELTLANEEGIAQELAVLTFDDPLWDLDKLELFDITTTAGRPTRLLEEVTHRGDQPLERFTVQKVCRFIELNVMELGTFRSEALARLSQGVYVQVLLDEIASAALERATVFWGYANPKFQSGSDTARKFAFIRRSMRGDGVSEQEYIWDDGY